MTKVTGQLFPQPGPLGSFSVPDLDPPSDPAPFTGTWSTKTPIPTARYDHATGVHNGLIYVAGGQQASSFLNTLYAYNPANDTWTAKANLPTTKGRTGDLANVSGNLYLAGGSTVGSATNTLHVYDTVANTWSTKTPMPGVKNTHATVAVNGIVYAIGGNATTVYAYNPANDTWTTKAPVPATWSNGAAVVVGSKVYLLGGDPVTVSGEVVRVYDTTSDTWSTVSSRPTKIRRNAGALAADGRIYEFGGADGGGTVLASTRRYDPAADLWITSGLPDLPAAVCAHGCARVGDTLYAIAGDSTGAGNAVATVYALPVVADPPAAPVTGDVVADDHPLIYWKMDSAAGATTEANLGSGAYPLTIGAAWTMGADGQAGTKAGDVPALSSSAANRAYTPFTRADQSFTVECWFKTTDPNAYLITTSKAGATFGGMALSLGGTAGPAFKVEGGSNGNVIGPGSGLVVPAGVSANLADGAWHHVAGVRAPGTLTLYVDGVSWGTRTNASATITTPANLNLGDWPNGADPTSPIRMQRVAYHTSALTAAQIASRIPFVPTFGPVFTGKPWTGQLWPRPDDLVPSGHYETSPFLGSQVRDTFTRADGPLDASITDSGHKWGGLGNITTAQIVGGKALLTTTYVEWTKFFPTYTDGSAVTTTSDVVTLAFDLTVTTSPVSDANFRFEPARIAASGVAVVLVQANNQTIFAYTDSGSSLTNFATFNLATPMAQNVERHISATYTKSTGVLQLFDNGALVGTGTVDATTKTALAGATSSALSIRKNVNVAYTVDNVVNYEGAGGGSSIPTTVGTSWAALAAPPLSRFYAQHAVAGGKMYQMGGETYDANSIANYAYDLAANSWSAALAPLPVARARGRAFTYNGKVHLIGGWDSGTNNIAAVNRYNPATNTWDTVAPMPAAAQGQYPGVAQLNGKFYVIKTNTTFVYDPVADTWTTLAAPFPGTAMANNTSLCATSTALYAFTGGRVWRSTDGSTWVDEAACTSGWNCVLGDDGKFYLKQSGTTFYLWSYDPVTKTQGTNTAVVTGTTHADGLVNVGGALLLDHEARLDKLVVTAGRATTFDNPGWVMETTAPVARYDHISGTKDGVVYVFGGRVSVGGAAWAPSTRVDKYDHTTGAWSTRAALDIPLCGTLASGWAGGKFYIAGGNNGDGSASNKIRRYDPDTNKWTIRNATIANPADGMGGNRHAMIDGLLWLVGGMVGGSPTDTVKCYSTGADAFAVAAGTEPYPIPVAYHGSDQIDGKLFVCGGITADSTNAVDRMYRFNPNTGKWKRMADMPAARCKHAVREFNGRLYVIGGATSSAGTSPKNTVFRYTPSTDTWETLPGTPRAAHSLTPHLVAKTPAVIGGTDGVLPGRYEMDRLSGVEQDFVPDPYRGLLWPRQ